MWEINGLGKWHKILPNMPVSSTQPDNLGNTE